MNNLQESPGLLRRIIDALRGRLGLFKKAGSFAAIGVVNTLVDFGVFVLAYKIAGLPVVAASLVAWIAAVSGLEDEVCRLVLANVPAWIVAVSGSYVMNSYITFAAESGRQLRPGAYGAFVLSGVAGLIANTTVLVLASYVMPVLIAKVLAIGVSFLVNFSISHFIVFRADPAKPDGGR